MPHLRVWIWRPTPGSATDDRHGRRCQKNRHKSLIDVATHIHCVYVDSFWETITYLTPTAADIYKGYSAKSMRDVPYDTRATAGRGARREQKAPRTAAEPASSPRRDVSPQSHRVSPVIMVSRLPLPSLPAPAFLTAERGGNRQSIWRLYIRMASPKTLIGRQRLINLTQSGVNLPVSKVGQGSSVP